MLDAARPALQGDLVVGNFEGVLGDSGTTYKCGRKGKHVTLADTAPPPPEPAPVARRRKPVAPPKTCYAFLTPTALAPRLAEGGFTHLNLANNHANDFGDDARATTERLLDSLGLRTYGPLGRIAVDTVRRGDSVTTVGLVGFTTYPYAYDLLDIARSVTVVDSVRGLVDLLVVTFHGGAEGTQRAACARDRGVARPRASRRAESMGSGGDRRRRRCGRGPRTRTCSGASNTIGASRSPIPWATFSPIEASISPARSGSPVCSSSRPARTGPGSGLDSFPWCSGRGAGPAPDSERAALDLVRALSSEDFGESAARFGGDGEIQPPE